jgi:hypothetical protein
MLDDETAIDIHPIATTEAIQGSAPGSYPILAAGGSDDNYTISLVPGILEIKKAKQTIDFQVSNKTLGDLPFSIYATATSGLPVTISTTSQKINLSGQTVALLEAGRVTIHASQSGNEYYDDAPTIEATFCINPEKPIITASSNGTATPVIESSSSSGNQWFLNSIAIANDQPVIDVKEGGVYTVSVTHDNCTSELSDPVSMIVTGINEEFSGSVVVFPNPTTTKLRLELPESTVPSITIIDTKGVTKEVIRVQDRLREVEIDVSEYAAGPYILLVKSNGLVFRQMFIKQ